MGPLAATPPAPWYSAIWYQSSRWHGHSDSWSNARLPSVTPVMVTFTHELGTKDVIQPSSALAPRMFSSAQHSIFLWLYVQPLKPVPFQASFAHASSQPSMLMLSPILMLRPPSPSPGFQPHHVPAPQKGGAVSIAAWSPPSVAFEACPCNCVALLCRTELPAAVPQVTFSPSVSSDGTSEGPAIASAGRTHSAIASVFLATTMVPHLRKGRTWAQRV
mmetsp:Transcript_99223/g.314972  ORF Transcript_99223/g.314972 Transcript_99223/m.314972 type:complete len:218 (-) Transcript_99223:58-711(-)